MIDVNEFSSLAQIAQMNASPVLHWSRSGVDTFVVEDDGATYRYRIGEADSTADLLSPAEAASVATRC